MAFGIEARVPFLDYRLVEFAFSLDSKMKIRNYENKWVVRQGAKTLLPESIWARKDKMGFISPQEIWQKVQLKPQFDDTFNKIRKDGIAGMPGLNAYELYKKYIAGNDLLWDPIWRYFCMKKWEDKYL